MTALCTNCTQAPRFPNQGRTLPWEGHAAKFGGVQVTRSARCPSDAAVKFTALPGAELPLEVAPQRQAGSRAARGADASRRPGVRRHPSPQARGTRCSAAAHPGGLALSEPRNPLRSVLIPSQPGPARLDTPLPSGRVEEAKNGAISGASVTCQPLEKGPVGGPGGAPRGLGGGACEALGATYGRERAGAWWQSQRRVASRSTGKGAKPRKRL